MPILCRISPTLSPIWGRGPGTGPTMPKATPERAATCGRSVRPRAHAEGGRFDLLGDVVEGRAGKRLCSRSTAPLDAPGWLTPISNHRVGRAFAVRNRRPWRRYLRARCKHAQLCAAEPVPVGGTRAPHVAGFLSQEGDGRHVDAGLRRGGVHRAQARCVEARAAGRLSR